MEPDRHDTIRDRILTDAATLAERMAALAMLAEVVRWCGGGRNCSKTGRELARMLRIEERTASHLLTRLETVGAIRRERRGKIKAIVLAEPPIRQAPPPLRSQNPLAISSESWLSAVDGEEVM